MWEKRGPSGQVPVVIHNPVGLDSYRLSLLEASGPLDVWVRMETRLQADSGE